MIQFLKMCHILLQSPECETHHLYLNYYISRERENCEMQGCIRLGLIEKVVLINTNKATYLKNNLFLRGKLGEYDTT